MESTLQLPRAAHRVLKLRAKGLKSRSSVVDPTCTEAREIYRHTVRVERVCGLKLNKARVTVRLLIIPYSLMTLVNNTTMYLLFVWLGLNEHYRKEIKLVD